MNTENNNAFQAAAVDADQVKEAIHSDGVQTLFTLDNGGIRCFVCTGKHEGDFLVFQSPATGKGFIVQAAGQDQSLHQQAREMLQAA